MKIQMKYSKLQLSLNEGLKKEWIITNGIGGYSSSTILGANTRKYHGLLIAPLTPPARRFLILSKLDESLKINDKEYTLYTNVCKNFISTGYKNLEYFEKDYMPVFSYQIENTSIKKIICMEYGKNTVCVYYKIKNGEYNSKLTIAPVINFRDFHCMNTNHCFDIKQEVKNNKVKAIVDDNITTPIYFVASEGKYTKYDGNDFKNMFYIEEEKRGFYPEENHNVPGIFEIELLPNEEKEISFVCSLEENIEQINVKEIISNEIIRLNELFYNTLLIDAEKPNEQDEMLKSFIQATDNFIVYRPSFGLHTIIAGYPWFLDWGRDSLISFEGLLLVTKRFEIAKEVLTTFVRDIKYGLIPNGYSGFDNRPLYNSADASLLLFEQVKKFLDYTSDIKFVKEEIYEYLEQIIDAYENGIDLDGNNIYLDEDNLIVSGTPETQNTWMDAKYLNFPITPRNGKAVEINAMWYNALKIMEELSKTVGKRKSSEKYSKLAEKCKESFEKAFYNKKRKCLYDVIGDSKIRPNQLFALSLCYPVIEPNSEIAKEIISTCNKKLLNKYGLKTLAKGEKGYIEVYEGDGFKRDSSYHQGITWPWLLGLYYNSLKNIIKFEKNKTEKKKYKEELDKFIETTEKTFIKEIEDGATVGSICEIYDSKTPQTAKGAIAQAWSVAEILRIILKK